MERLTIIDGCGNDELARCMNCGLEKAGSNLENCGMCEEGWQRALRRLAAYEVTGLTPEEIKNALDVNDIIPEINVTVDHIRDLLKAEQEGRLVVLPCKTKETVYVVGEKRIIECFIAEVYIDDARGLEYMVSFDCDNACDGCPFNSWRQDYSGEYSCDGEYGDGCILGSDFGKTVFLTREEAEAALAQEGGTHEADSV